VEINKRLVTIAPMLLLTCLTAGLVIFVVLSRQSDESCRVEALNADARASGEIWCQRNKGVFTLVTVRNDAKNYVVLLQFSRKGQSLWRNYNNNLNGFRHFTDKMLENGDVDVGLSLYDTHRGLLGGCTRRHDARESTCVTSHAAVDKSRG
jgi:hypothetical protein